MKKLISAFLYFTLIFSMSSVAFAEESIAEEPVVYEAESDASEEGSVMQEEDADQPAEEVVVTEEPEDPLEEDQQEVPEIVETNQEATESLLEEVEGTEDVDNVDNLYYLCEDLQIVSVSQDQIIFLDNNTENTWSSGTYVVGTDLEIINRITVDGNVTLIILMIAY